jgi:hypothetical protein
MPHAFTTKQTRSHVGVIILSFIKSRACDKVETIDYKQAALQYCSTFLLFHMNMPTD